MQHADVLRRSSRPADCGCSAQSAALSLLLGRVGQAIADRIEGVPNLAGEAGHCDHRTYTDQTCDQGVLDEVLARLVPDEGYEQLRDFIDH